MRFDKKGPILRGICKIQVLSIFGEFLSTLCMGAVCKVPPQGNDELMVFCFMKLAVVDAIRKVDD
jgi:hypothetical protein